MSEKDAARKARHWSRTANLTYIVLAVWALFAFILPWNAKALNNFSFLGFDLGYYIVVQGSLIVFVLLIVFQNFRQDAIDDEYENSGK